MSIEDLVAAATAEDGVAPFNEATTIALAGGGPWRVREMSEDAAALALAGAPVELVVHPQRRRRGHGGALLDRLIASGERRFWSHGDLAAARALAVSRDLVATRTLLVLRLDLDVPPDVPQPEGVTLRAFEERDADAIVAINGRAFASHPEQGAMDRADFDQRRAQEWFDPAGLFVAERDGEVVGFHWTKVEDGIGEVYVVGVDPEAHGGGLGTALTARGLRHLWDEGLRIVDLYVEGDNLPALAVYRRLGFREHARDVLWSVA
ncbi:mycothiol synthase [Aeromicrobium phragmitis]|uniref:Mycothiol acetyltransferase n=1 Tax=Aeromicrobium phragmitis TaxID=2478914 RepID=A0A3L8PHX3_9ACTN|nr:mycothiol synthase [Aeromicrobium phragmitis]RLV54906.1 mycothiol synthase [Aeromicrobium phragmitis]